MGSMTSHFQLMASRLLFEIGAVFECRHSCCI